jgi:DNA-directed RNA polymerase subunit F
MDISLFDKYAAVITLDGYTQIFNKGITWNAAVDKIYYIFRNFNKTVKKGRFPYFRRIDIHLRMLKLQNMLTDGSEGLQGGLEDKSLSEVVRIFENTPELYKQMLSEARKEFGLPVPDTQYNEYKDVLLSSLTLNHNIINTLTKVGISTIGNALQIKEGEWEKIPHFTKGAFDALKHELETIGVVLPTHFNPELYSKVRVEWDHAKKNNSKRKVPAVLTNDMLGSATSVSHSSGSSQHDSSIRMEQPRSHHQDLTLTSKVSENNTIRHRDPVSDFILLPSDKLIGDLDLSNRLKNLLRRNDIFTLSDLINARQSDIENIPGMGGHSFRELTSFLTHTKVMPTSGDSDRAISVSFTGNQTDINSDEWIVPISVTYDTNIYSLDFDLSLKHDLKGFNIKTVKDLLVFEKRNRKYLETLSSRKPDYIENWINEISHNAYENALKDMADIPETLSKEKLINACFAFSNMLGTSFESIILGVINSCKDNSFCDHDYVSSIWSDHDISNLISQYILIALDKAKFEGVTRLDLIKLFPDLLVNTEVLSDKIDELVKNGQAKINGDYIIRKFPYLKDWLANYDDARNAEIFKLRIKGMTLGDIGKLKGVTRERVRQIIIKILSKLPTIEEDRFVDLRKKYSQVTDNEFKNIFDISDDVMGYVDLRVRSGKEDYSVSDSISCIYRILSDFDRSSNIFKRTRNVLNEISPYFVINGEKVLKDRVSLLKYVLRHYCKEQKSVSEISTYYDALCRKLGINQNKSFVISDLRYFDHLAAYPYTICSRGKIYRYYDINAQDFDHLLGVLDLSSYQDVFISTVKFFRDYPNVMREYDIRDEYELHNILRKTWDQNHLNDYLDDHHKVFFRKMPTIVIGKADKDKQVLDFIRANEPIKKSEIFKLFEQEYGFKSNSISANGWFNNAEKYCIAGQYSLDWQGLPKDRVQHMKKLLTDDFYFTADIMEQYEQEYPDGNIWDINGYSLHQLGFKSHGKYVIRNCYPYATSYFQHLLLNGEDELDLRDMGYLSSLSPFNFVLDHLCSTYELVEYLPGKYYSKQFLDRIGITKDKIKDFCDDVYQSVADGKLFTIFSLKKTGMNMPFKNVHLTDWFYSSLLRADQKRFTGQSFGGGCLLVKGENKHEITRGDLFNYVIESQKEMVTTPEISHIIERDYGLTCTYSVIKEYVLDNPELKDKVLV